MTQARKPTTRALSWGRQTLPKLRSQAGLTREELAERADIAPGTLRAIEAGRVAATPSQKQAVRTVVRLATLYPPASLVIPFSDVQKRDVVRDALKEFAERRRSPSEFVDSHYPKASPEEKARHIDWTADGAATALALLQRIKHGA
jgi:transcriptional regulator with XRE-family HTH domain